MYLLLRRNMIEIYLGHISKLDKKSLEETNMRVCKNHLQVA